MPQLPNPYDGFRPELFESELNQHYELYIVLYAGGRRTGQHKVAVWPLRGDHLGEAQSHFYLLQAMCRFMNTGTDPVQILRLFENVFDFVEDRLPAGLEPPWHLQAVMCNVEEPTHVFSDGYDCVVVKEDLYSESMTLVQLIEQAYDGPEITYVTEDSTRKDPQAKECSLPVVPVTGDSGQESNERASSEHGGVDLPLPTARVEGCPAEASGVKHVLGGCTAGDQRGA